MAVVVRPAPPLDPPYEDATQPPDGMEPLPVEVIGEEVEPQPPARVPPRRLPRAPQPPRPTDQRTALVTARAALQRFVGTCVEVLNGYRPSAHLRPITDGQRFSDVSDQLVRRTVRIRMSPGQAARHGRLVRVRRMLVCEPVDGVAEAAVVLEQGERSWAMAVRMERAADLGVGVAGWLCTVVRVI